MPEFNGKTAVVTGASSGIGAALAKLLSARGCRVALNARRKEKLEAQAEQCPGETISVIGDITDPQCRRSIVDRTINRWGNIDILVNNAGLGAYGQFMETTEDDWRSLLEVNLMAPVLLTREVLPHMMDRNRGTILNIASIGGLIAHSDKVSAYVAVKHALVGFSRGLAKDLAGTGIRILAACPHITDTEFFKVSPGADEMAPVIEKYKTFMDTPLDVAEGMLRQFDSEKLIIFPTEKPEHVYFKQRDI